MSEGLNKTRPLLDAEKRFDFQAKGLYYDLRFMSTRMDEWQKWKDDLLDMTESLFIEIYRANQVYMRRSELTIALETEQSDNHMYFRFFSDVGKVELVFDLKPETLEITYQKVVLTKYEEVYSLFT